MFRLTAAEVKRLSRQPGKHSDGAGLFLNVSPAGVPSWVYRYMIDGRERYMGLGPLHVVSLKEARDKALAQRKLRVDGLDPLEERQASRQAAKTKSAKTRMTFRQCAEAYIAAHRAAWSRKHAKQWPATLEAYAFPVFGDVPVDQVDVGLVMRAIEPVWQTKAETASRVRGRVESVVDWATARGYRTGENPARWRGHLENLLPKKSKVQRVTHHPALPYAELPAFMTELRQLDGVAARALEFTILTVARTGEVIGAKRPEVDQANRLWIVPADRMKAGKEHRVPLADRAIEIVDAMAARKGEFLFPGNPVGRPLGDKAMAKELGRLRPGVSVHGMRSSFSDWCAEQTNFPSEVREMALAHAVADKVEAAYRRGDLMQKRRALAEAWGRYCCTTPAGPTREIIPLRAAQ
jgi:integrase